jgi:hypothetical protein
VEDVLAAKTAELLPLNFILCPLTLTGGVVPVATFGAFEEDVAFLVLHDRKG